MRDVVFGAKRGGKIFALFLLVLSELRIAGLESHDRPVN
jgi:hypothetical protein